MLNLLLGPAGAGKTTHLLDICDAAAEKGGEVIYIVPEQASFDAERRILQQLGEKKAILCEVLSFTRLCHRIMRTYGRIASARLSESGKAALMSRAVDSVRDYLKVYSSSGRKTDTVKIMLDAVAEFKSRAVTPEIIENAAAVEKDSMLGKRLFDMSLIYSAYNALLAETGIDPSDLPFIACDVLGSNNFFADITVIIDSFKSFTPGEEQLLKKILGGSKEVWVSLCCDSLDDPAGGFGLFSPVKETAERVLKFAREVGTPAASPVILNDSVRYRSPALRALEKGIYPYGNFEVFADPTEDVNLTECADPYSEAMACGQKICALIRQGYRYRDIAVVVRSSAEWEEIIAPVMRLFNIPVFMDRRVPVDNFPITAFIVGAMNVVCGSYKSEDILRWLKTGLTDISEDEVFTLENYIFTWDISGKQWLTPFTLNPEGYVPESEKTKTKLEAINDIRKRAVAPIEKFASAAGDTDIFHIASALYALMCDCHADTHLQELAEKLEQTDGELASRQLRMWDVIIGLLDQSVQLLGKERMSLADFSQLFGYMLGTSDLGSIPSYTDQVTFAQADRTRLDDPKILFVLGANEGKFPKAVSSFGAFTDTERRRLEQLGVNVAKPSENMALDERLLNYFTLTQPSQKLFVSYSLSDTDSSPLSPSETVEIIKNVLPDIEINKYHSAESCDDLETDAQSFEVLARRYGKKDALSQGLCSYFEQKPEYKSRLRALGRAAQNRPFEFENPAVARRLFGEKMLLSATRVENFSTCKFKYFCRFGLGAYPRLSAKVDAMRYGSVMHYVFENVFTRYGGRKISKLSSEELTQVIRTLIADYIEREMGGTLDKTPRFMYLFEKLADTAYLLVKKMGEEFAQSDFETAAYELSISPNGKVKPLTIRTKSGIELSVIGSVDRVDVMTGENGNYFRVVDYKTSKKMFGLSDILYGLNMQMLIYLIAIWKNGGEIFPGYLPAGVLYMPAIKPQPSKSRDPVSGEQTTICMNGLLLGEPRVLSGMEKALAGKFIPVKLKSDGSFLGENSLVTLSQFGQIAEHIEVLLEKMAQSLCGGDIEALPTVLSKSPCEYCDYSAVCGHEKDSPSVLAEKFDKAAVLEKLCVKEEEK